MVARGADSGALGIVIGAAHAGAIHAQQLDAEFLKKFLPEEHRLPGGGAGDEKYWCTCSRPVFCSGNFSARGQYQELGG